MFEKAFLSSVKAGEVKEVTFGADRIYIEKIDEPADETAGNRYPVWMMQAKRDVKYFRMSNPR